MAGYIVELRDNKFGVTEADGSSAWIGESEVWDETYREMMPKTTIVRKREMAKIFEVHAEANRVTKPMPDAFFDRFWPTVAEAKDSE